MCLSFILDLPRTVSTSNTECALPSLSTKVVEWIIPSLLTLSRTSLRLTCSIMQLYNLTDCPASSVRFCCFCCILYTYFFLPAMIALMLHIWRFLTFRLIALIWYLSLNYMLWTEYKVVHCEITLIKDMHKCFTVHDLCHSWRGVGGGGLEEVTGRIINPLCFSWKPFR